MYLGGHAAEAAAALAYDLAALKFRGVGTILNFPLENYLDEMPVLDQVGTTPTVPCNDILPRTMVTHMPSIQQTNLHAL